MGKRRDHTRRAIDRAAKMGLRLPRRRQGLSFLRDCLLPLISPLAHRRGSAPEVFRAQVAVEPPDMDAIAVLNEHAAMPVAQVDPSDRAICG
jgi:hypothetical protein